MFRLLFLIFFSSSLLWAGGNIACVDTDRILKESKLVAQAQSMLMSKLQELQGKLQELQKRIEDLRKQASSKALSEEKRKKKEEELTKLEGEAVALQQKAQRELSQMKEELENKVYNKVKEASRKIADQRNLAGVIDCGLFVYFKPELDITDQVIKLVDEGLSKK